MSRVHLFSREKIKEEEIDLPSSKSISNRALIIQSLLNHSFEIQHLSEAEDTKKLNEILESLPDKINSGDGGTTFRFLLPFLCTLQRKFEISGSKQMNSRPIQPLVDALNQMGGNINYLDHSGKPPLEILPSDFSGGQVLLNSAISSQFISALMLVGPILKNGIQIQLESDPVSISYIDMTEKVMEFFQVKIFKEKNSIRIPSQKYIPRNITIEADWSAAAFFYEWIALSQPGTSLRINGLKKSGIQGDEQAEILFNMLGVETRYTAHGAIITKSKAAIPNYIEFNFITCPDLAQAFIASCACLKVKGLFTGLQTLKHKETNRVFALQEELKKIGAQIEIDEDSLRIVDVVSTSSSEIFHTYGDHRMAMCLAPLINHYSEITIDSPEVVSKSFPRFWKEIEKLCVLKFD